MFYFGKPAQGLTLALGHPAGTKHMMPPASKAQRCTIPSSLRSSGTWVLCTSSATMLSSGSQQQPAQLWEHPPSALQGEDTFPLTTTRPKKGRVTHPLHGGFLPGRHCSLPHTSYVSWDLPRNSFRGLGCFCNPEEIQLPLKGTAASSPASAASALPLCYHSKQPRSTGKGSQPALPGTTAAGREVAEAASRVATPQELHK